MPSMKVMRSRPTACVGNRAAIDAAPSVNHFASMTSSASPKIIINRVINFLYFNCSSINFLSFIVVFYCFAALYGFSRFVWLCMTLQALDLKNNGERNVLTLSLLLLTLLRRNLENAPKNI